MKHYANNMIFFVTKENANNMIDYS